MHRDHLFLHLDVEISSKSGEIMRNIRKLMRIFWIPVNLTPNPWKIGEVLRNLGILS
jgi:hypothetical protein